VNAKQTSKELHKNKYKKNLTTSTSTSSNININTSSHASRGQQQVDPIGQVRPVHSTENVDVALVPTQYAQLFQNNRGR
jgi:hypothetical protein